MIYCILSPTLVLLEEFIVAKDTWYIVRSVYNGLSDKEWETMTEVEKVKIEKYYEFIEYRYKRKLQIMARESSIQLTYQNALVLYQFVNPPIRELDYTPNVDYKIFSWKVGEMTAAHTFWVVGLTIQLVSVGLSAYSTFSPILEDLKFQRFKKDRQHVSVFSYLIKVVQVFLHIIYSTGVVYL